MMRSVGAVVGGYVIFALSAVVLFQVSGRPPEIWPGWPLAAFSIVYGAVFGAAAGGVAARLAPRSPRGHAMIVAGLIAAAATASLVLQPGGGSPWSQIATLIVFAPSAIAGGFLQSSRAASGDV